MFMCGLVLLLSSCFEKDFQSKTVWLEFTHTSPMTDPEFILFVFPKLLGAQICTGSQVFQAFTDTFEGAQSRKLHHQLFKDQFRCDMMYCTLIMVCIYNTVLYSKLCYIIHLILFRCEFRVTLILFSCDLLLLLFYQFYLFYLIL